MKNRISYPKYHYLQSAWHKKLRVAAKTRRISRSATAHHLLHSRLEFECNKKEICDKISRSLKAMISVAVSNS
jgi:hypothetical protein